MHVVGLIMFILVKCWGSIFIGASTSDSHCIGMQGSCRQDAMLGPVWIHIVRLPVWSTWKCFGSAPESASLTWCPCTARSLSACMHSPPQKPCKNP